MEKQQVLFQSILNLHKKELEAMQTSHIDWLDDGYEFKFESLCERNILICELRVIGSSNYQDISKNISTLCVYS